LRLEEDWEWDCRVAALGTKLAHVPEFLVEVRDHGEDRLSRGERYDKLRLRDRAFSHATVYQTARGAGMGAETPHMARYARELFLLARQAGAAGLAVEAKDLFRLAREAAGERKGNGADFTMYAALVAVLGWRCAGVLSCWIDDSRQVWRGN
jgi:hypothetical protein